MTHIPQDLFPAPSLPPSQFSPSHWPGLSYESTEALRASLKENHEKFHVFFNSQGFHNHLTHYLLALWALGADTEIITAAHKHESSYQLPAYESPEPITAENFKDHLGDEKFYNAYLKFYTDAIQSKGALAVLEEHVFDQKANFDGSGGVQPEMLNRFLDALLHPMIHVGYGLEFGLPGMVVEGLASTAIHKTDASAIIPPSLWTSTQVSPLESVTARLPLALSLGSHAPSSPSKNVHAFTIVARMLQDPQFNAIQNTGMAMYTTVVDNHSEALNKYANGWTFDRSDPKEVERKIEELVWTNVLIYGIGGWTKGEEFKGDFFFMHLVTSSLFLSSIVANLKPASQELLLRSYFVSSLAWWIARGRPRFDIAGFFAHTTAFPVSHGPFPTPHPKSIPSATSPKASTPNPWFTIIQASLVIPDEHLPKLQRALAHFAALYGTRAPGQPDFASSELPDAEKLDGSLFVRIAGLTNEPLHSGKDVDVFASLWDRKGFFDKL